MVKYSELIKTRAEMSLLMIIIIVEEKGKEREEGEKALGMRQPKPRHVHECIWHQRSQSMCK